MNALYPPGTGVAPPELIRSLSGLESVEAGRVVSTGEPTPAAYNPIGAIHGGYAATRLDSCMACAIHSELPAGSGYTTLELKVSYVRTLTHDSGRIRAIGRTLQVGRRAAIAEGEIRDAQERLCAHGTTTCLIISS